MIRTDPSELRKAVLKRDNGICAACGLDTIALKLELDLLRRKEGEVAWTARCEQLRIPKGKRERSLWECDHIISVAEGGGGTGLANAQSLCYLCHAEKTRELVKKLRGK